MTALFPFPWFAVCNVMEMHQKLKKNWNKQTNYVPYSCFLDCKLLDQSVVVSKQQHLIVVVYNSNTMQGRIQDFGGGGSFSLPSLPSSPFPPLPSPPALPSLPLPSPPPFPPLEVGPLKSS